MRPCWKMCQNSSFFWKMSGNIKSPYKISRFLIFFWKSMTHFPFKLSTVICLIFLKNNVHLLSLVEHQRSRGNKTEEIKKLENSITVTKYLNLNFGANPKNIQKYTLNVIFNCYQAFNILTNSILMDWATRIWRYWHSSRLFWACYE